MSTVASPKRHRHTQSATAPPPAFSSKNPQNPHHLNVQSYAQDSQSDMSDQFQLNLKTPPRTPRRNDQPSQIRTTDTGSRQKSRNKNRYKNVLTSPAAARTGCNTPPFTGAPSGDMPSSANPISTASTTAYAGATFHASPAPSALPIPSFYSKSVPDSPGTKVLQMKDALLAHSPTPLLPVSNTPPQQSSQLPREESPLDFFFKADREQKARAKSASSSQTSATATGPYQLPRQTPRVSQTPPVTGSHNQMGHRDKGSPSAIFTMELDGDCSAGSPIEPAFSTPYAERINAARTRPQPTLEAQSTLDRSEALKAYLFLGQQLPPSIAPAVDPLSTTPIFRNTEASSTGSQNCTANFQSKSAGFPQRSKQTNFAISYDSKPFKNAPRTSGRTSGLRQEVTPTWTPPKIPDRDAGYCTSPIHSQSNRIAPSSGSNHLMNSITSNTSSNGVSSEGRGADIQGMEDSLRKILKLDPAGSPGGGVAGSVLNHGVGRAPPVNGMHNGVMGS